MTFSFDDFPRTAYAVGGTILKSFDARGTYYAAAGLVSTSNELGEQFCPEDLHSMLRDGHELGSHTFGHLSCRSVPLLTFREDVERGRKAIQELSGAADSGNFAYPFGDVTRAAKKMVGSAMASCRGIFPGLNGPIVDLNLLKGNSLYGDVDRFGLARELILENEKRRAWLIFYSHDVRPKPSKYGCTPSLLESTISFALQHSSRVLTVKEVLAEMEIHPA